MRPTRSHAPAQTFSAYRVFAARSAAITMLTGLLVLTGWAFDISVFKRLLPGLTAMVPITAIGFLLAGAALWCLQREQAALRRRRLGQVCAGLVALIGGLTLLEYGLGVDLSIDRWLFAQAARVEGELYPGRPAPATTLGLLSLGMALLAIDVKSVWLVPLLTLSTFFIALQAVLGYAYGVAALYEIGPDVPVALHTALVFLLLSLGIIAARPEHPSRRVITSDLAGSFMARRLLPAAILLPFGLGWLRLMGQDLGLYDTAFGVALFATSNIVIFVGLIYWNAARLNQTDAKSEAAHAQVRKSEERFHWLFDATPNGLMMVGTHGRIVLANAQAERLFGYRPGQLLGQTIDQLVPERFRARHPAFRQTFSADPRARPMGVGRDLYGLRQDGAEFPIEIGLSPIETAEGSLTLASIIDITERKRAESALRHSEERFAKAFHASPVALSITRLADGRFVDVNDQFLQIFGYSSAEIIGGTSIELNMFVAPVDRTELVRQLRADGTVRNYEMQMHAKSGAVHDVLFSTAAIESDGEAHVIATLIDVTERVRAEQKIRLLNATLEQRVAERTTELRATAAKLSALFEVLPVGVSIVNAQQQVVEINPALKRILRISDQAPMTGAAATRTYIRSDGTPMRPEDFASARAMHEQQPIHNVETGVMIETGETIWISVSAAPLAIDDLAAVIVTTDITARKQLEEQLARQAEELRRSNAELEQFAYVASHDLQEPLRMVTSYVQLLQRRYQGQLDAKADLFIGYAVDGAARMQTLIQDLLAYSRVGWANRGLAPTDCARLLEQVRANLAVTIADAGATITAGPLPTVLADAGQIGQLFQNLISNAIKFHGTEPPQIQISATRQGAKWLFAVRDNGIGIDPQYAERIFVIFQRLHTRAEYPGTGIGLAICEKIVDHHGGRIWIESQPGQGTTFYFTLLIIEALGIE